MHTTPAPSAALAVRPATPVPAPPRRRRGPALRRLAAAALLVACSGLAGPAAAEEAAHPRAEPARGGGALLLLSFLVPLPLPMALVAAPQATRAPRPAADACAGSRRQPGCVATRRGGAR